VSYCFQFGLKSVVEVLLVVGVALAQGLFSVRYFGRGLTVKSLFNFQHTGSGFSEGGVWQHPQMRY